MVRMSSMTKYFHIGIAIKSPLISPYAATEQRSESRIFLWFTERVCIGGLVGKIKIFEVGSKAFWVAKGVDFPIFEGDGVTIN